MVVVNIPTQGDEKLVDEILACFGFVILGGQIPRLVGFECGSEGLNPVKRLVESLRLHARAE